MGRSSNQMRIAPALAAAKRCNKFVIRHNKGMIFHANPPATAPTRSLPAILGASSALRRPGPPTKRAWSARKMASKRRRLYEDLFCSPQLGDGTLDEGNPPLSVLPTAPSFREGLSPPRFWRPRHSSNKSSMEPSWFANHIPAPPSTKKAIPHKIAGVVRHYVVLESMRPAARSILPLNFAEDHSQRLLRTCHIAPRLDADLLFAGSFVRVH
jgi:hypothetical protein